MFSSDLLGFQSCNLPASLGSAGRALFEIRQMEAVANKKPTEPKARKPLPAKSKRGKVGPGVLRRATFGYND